MDSKEKLNSEIRFAFGDVKFPIHCGWNAAIAKDEWVYDPEKLVQITKEKDIQGKWWEIPFSELDNCSMAQCYLDAEGVAFYLPAYLIGAIDNTNRKKYSPLISWLNPGVNDNECNLYDYFCANFSLINKPRKLVCIKVLKYILEHIEPHDMFSKDEIDSVLNHEFWKVKC